MQEFAAGGDLFGAMKRAGGQFAEEIAARNYVLPCLQALAHLHGKVGTPARVTWW